MTHSMTVTRLCVALLGWLLCLTMAAAASPTERLLWPEQAGRDPQAGEKRDNRGTSETPNRAIFKVSVPTLTVYLPEEGRATGAGVVICPGGGYLSVVIDKEGHALARWFNSIGVAAFVLKYRLPDPAQSGAAEPLPLQDAKQALRLVRGEAARYHLRPDRIGILGASAGGHLASALSTHFDTGQSSASEPLERVSCRPDFAILLYPVVSMAQPYAHQASRKRLLGDAPTSAALRLYSNEEQVTATTPPTFMALADDDKSVDPENSVAYYQALRRAGVPAELHLYQRGAHGFGLCQEPNPASSWPRLCVEWMTANGLLNARGN